MMVGVLGGGQLARMLALAGYPLGLRFRIYDTPPEAPAEHVAEYVQGDFDDWPRIRAFAEGLDLVTYEFENVPVETVAALADRLPVWPPAVALATSQDRLPEKELFRRLGLPTPRYVAVDSRESLASAVEAIGTPAILKTRRLGYDGKGQFLLRTAGDVDAAWQALGGLPLILEAFVPFDRELSMIAVRTPDGVCAFYPLIENHHRAGILRESRAPAAAASAGPPVTSAPPFGLPDRPATTPPEPTARAVAAAFGPTASPAAPASGPSGGGASSAALQAQAQDYARRVLEALGYVGVLAIEFFQVSDELYASEMAPRVHNSGHWTIEGATTSQFENHLRAIMGLPLGSTRPRGDYAMLNLIGAVPDAARVLAIPGAHLHDYGKEPRPGRKVGHVTVACAQPGVLPPELLAL